MYKVVWYYWRFRFWKWLYMVNPLVKYNAYLLNKYLSAYSAWYKELTKDANIVS